MRFVKNRWLTYGHARPERPNSGASPSRVPDGTRLRSHVCLLCAPHASRDPRPHPKRTASLSSPTSASLCPASRGVIGLEGFAVAEFPLWATKSLAKRCQSYKASIACVAVVRTIHIIITSMTHACLNLYIGEPQWQRNWKGRPLKN